MENQTNLRQSSRVVNTTEFLSVYQALCRDDEPIDSIANRHKLLGLIFGENRGVDYDEKFE